MKVLNRILPSLALVLAGAILAAGCGKRSLGPSKPLGSQARVTLKDAWILEHTPPLLELVLVFEGGNPNRNYDFKAALRQDEHGSDMGGGWIHQVPIPQGPATNEHRVMWEFLSYPQGSRNIYFRLDYTDKQTGQASSVDFKLPGARHLRVRKMGSQ